MRRRWVVMAAAAAGLLGCRPLSDDEAVQLVRTYNSRVIEAFRTGDAKLIGPVTGPADGKRLTGLIGVKSDMGITLDSKLIELKPLRVTSGNDEVIVYTEERWSYRDRRIGSGEQVGEASNDHYFMRYHLRKHQGRWVVDEIAFDREPVVGRKELPYQIDAQIMHGNIQTVDPEKAGAVPSEGRRGTPGGPPAVLPSGHPELPRPAPTRSGKP